MSDLTVVIAAARKWRDEIQDYIEPDAGEEEKPGYADEADAISAAADTLEHLARTGVNMYVVGNADGPPDRFGLIYHDEDEAMECGRENDLTVWKMPVLPLWDAAVMVESDADREDSDA